MYADTVDTKDQNMWYIQWYVCQHSWYKTHPHISAHNLLNIQPIVNPKKVLTFRNAIYINTVDASCKYF